MVENLQVISHNHTQHIRMVHNLLATSGEFGFIFVIVSILLTLFTHIIQQLKHSLDALISGHTQVFLGSGNVS